MFHADLHPANLMILPDNVVGYVDFGITGVLSQSTRAGTWWASPSPTREAISTPCAEAFFKVAVMDGNSDPKGFRAGAGEAGRYTWYELKGKERRLKKNFTLVMLDMLRLSRAHPGLARAGRRQVHPLVHRDRRARSPVSLPGFDVGSYLAAACDRHPRQEGWRMLFSYDRMVEWSAATGNLAQDGGARALQSLDRMTRRERTPQTLPADRPATGVPALQAFRFASVTLAISVLITVTGESAAIGANLFTAEILIAAASLAMFLKTLRRCI